MGRGTAREVEELKVLIVSEAARLFAAHGFGATSISDIAKAAGVSKALVLYHFSSKDRLRERVMGDLARAWSERFPRVRDIAAEGDDVVRAMFVEGVAILRQHPDLARLVMREILSEDPKTRQALKSAAIPIIESLETVLRDAYGAQVTEGFDAQAAFVFFGLGLLAVVAAYPLDGDPLTDDATELGLRVLKQGLGSLGLVLDHKALLMR
ncbi:MAG: AcrR family transcriptional regulator [Myxococcota bacterium]|jgi:AcrR family transcriptional regulator